MALNYTVIGIMSGTSLDGVDLACVFFTKKGQQWSYKLVAGQTYSYSKAWKERLKVLIHQDAALYAQTHTDLGHLFAWYVNKFIKEFRLKPDLIASHGHTIFHQPALKFTSQIGEGAAIASLTGIPVVCDFRTTDLSKGGQGAPLVPIGDRLLFGKYHYCLNLGGIANISFEQSNQRIAFDICPVNMAMNYVAGFRNKAYDKNGLLASKGKVSYDLLKKLNALAFYRKTHPKSLGAEWFNRFFKPLLDGNPYTPEDLLATLAEHMVWQIKKVLDTNAAGRKKTMLITGGGAHNKFLVLKMKQLLPVEIVIPEKEVIDFKEAIIFALLGLLRLRHEKNTLASVTGAGSDSSSGAIYLP